MRCMTIAGAMFALLLSGCAPLMNRQPAPAYADLTHPTSDTAIVACPQDSSHGCSIDRVDQFGTRGAMWVRVLPGAHQFSVAVTKGTWIGSSTLNMPKMEPGHAYEIIVNDYGPKFSLSANDLGKRDAYSMRVGLEHFNATEFSAKF